MATFIHHLTISSDTVVELFFFKYNKYKIYYIQFIIVIIKLIMIYFIKCKLLPMDLIDRHGYRIYNWCIGGIKYQYRSSFGIIPIHKCTNVQKSTFIYSVKVLEHCLRLLLQYYNIGEVRNQRCVYARNSEILSTSKCLTPEELLATAIITHHLNNFRFRLCFNCLQYLYRGK